MFFWVLLFFVVFFLHFYSIHLTGHTSYWNAAMRQTQIQLLLHTKSFSDVRRHTITKRLCGVIRRYVVDTSLEMCIFTQFIIHIRQQIYTVRPNWDAASSSHTCGGHMSTMVEYGTGDTNVVSFLPKTHAHFMVLYPVCKM